MNRSRVAVFVALIAVQPHPMAANQAVERFRVSKALVADVDQETLHAFNPESRQTTEVFPGTYRSPYGEALMKRIESLQGRVDEADREELVATKAAAGVDRSITAWRADPTGRKVAIAVRYFRDRLFQLELAVTDDYGRSDPVDPARYQSFTIAVCARTGADVWTCDEEQLAAIASRNNVPLPQDRTERLAALEKLLELVLAGK